MQISMDDSLKDVIIEDYKAGVSVLGIANKYNLYRRAVHDILKDTIIAEADRVVPYHGAKSYNAYSRRPCSRHVEMTPEIEKVIETTYAETGNVTKAAATAGVTWMTARKVLFVNGRIPMRNRQRGWSYKEIPADVRAGMLREYRKGRGMQAIAEMFDSNYPAVRAVLRDAGIRPKARNTAIITPEVAADIARDYKTGSTFDELRETYRRSYRTLRNVLTDAGVTIRKCGSAPKIVPPYTAMALGLA